MQEFRRSQDAVYIHSMRVPHTNRRYSCSASAWVELSVPVVDRSSLARRL